jgi:hypothetical protein
MGRVYFWKTFSEGSGEPDPHIVESQNYPLHISDDAREGFLANFLFNLPVVAIPHASTRRLVKLYRSACAGSGAPFHRRRQSLIPTNP